MSSTAEYLAAEYVHAKDATSRKLAMEWLMEDIPDAHERTLLLEEALADKTRFEKDVQAARLRELGWVDKA